MINFDEFDIEEHRNENILEFLSREGIRIIKTCGEKNTKIVADVIKSKKARWADGGVLTEGHLMWYKFIFIGTDNVIRYSNSSMPYISRRYSGYYYYDMCDGNVHKMKQKK